MPVEVAAHVKGRVCSFDARLNWEVGNIIIWHPVGHKWKPKEKRRYQIILISFWDEEEAMKWQGRGAGLINLNAIHATDGERAKMRNRSLISPPPKRLRIEHITKGPHWDNPQIVADIMIALAEAG